MENLQSQKIKGIILAVGAFLTIFLALKSWEVIREISSPKLDRPAITIIGEGKIFVEPNIGQINLGVIAEATTVSAAQKKASEDINKVMASLEANGIDKKDIKATSYNISPKYDYGSYPFIPPSLDGATSRVPKIVGYSVSQNLDVKIRDTSKVGKILSDVGQAGANQQGGLSFTTEDPSAVQAEARAKAIENANKKGKELEEKLGIKLGKIIGFYESGGPYPIYRGYALGLGKGGGEVVPSPEIPIGENEVVVNVSVTYQIR
ncbi:hypothetical protein A2Y47_01345 [Candidatus Giovannonibacteria bacterium RIFCSPLOWO2_12_43_8]|uniref:26 kDa periplasmic immunogenic protein n=1 Tax=Candidatus Giovannonibacteria bacterium RIFCSPLOWO2_12_43_8 TaxID=1798361 RepID=A0A1F5Y1W4_9BACT|nr:MAG: hypothetical protein A2Y47_01345 [Candidatus Giovannonibacteria bacterium RIFCSPLOWO2_12_43_8]